MKKLLTLVLLGLFTISITSSARKVVLEEFTNTSCGPCAYYNPSIMEFLEDNWEDVIPIFFHVSWPSDQDPMYVHNAAISNARRSTYNFNSVPWTVIGGNAYSNNPDIAAMQTAVNNVLGKGISGFEIEVEMTKNGNQFDVDVMIDSDKNLSGKSLKVVIGEAYLYYPSPGSNGETEFLYTAREMLPNASGTDINLNIGDSHTYEFSFTPRGDMKPDWLYAVAFVQDKMTNEILDGASTPYPTPAEIEAAKVSLKPTFAQQFVKKPNEQSSDLEIIVSNNKDFEVEADVAIDYDGSYVPQGWTVSLSENEVTLAPGESATITANVTIPGTNGMALAVVNVTPKNLPADKIGLVGSDIFGVLSENTKYAIYTMYSSAASLNYSDLAGTDYYADAAMIPYTDDTRMAYPPSDFDVLILPQRASSYRGFGPVIPESFLNVAKAHMQMGKGVMINSNANLYYSFRYTSQPAPPGYRTFYNWLGIGSAADLVPRFTIQNQQVYISPFNVFGDNMHDASRGITIAGNPNTQAYDWFTENISITNTVGSVTPIYYYDQANTEIGGVAIEQDGGKMVYTTFTLACSNNSTARAAFMEQSMDWLLAGGGEKEGPKINSDVATLEFGDVEVGEESTETVTITNEGDEDLVISEITFAEFVDPGIFEVTYPTSEFLPQSIEPGDNIEVEVKFMPDEETSFSEQMIIANNSEDQPNFSITLSGDGMVAGGIFDDEARVTLSLNVGPNPFDVATKISLNLETSGSLEVYVIDASGRRISELANGAFGAGSQEFDFSAGGLAAGTYYVIAKTGAHTAQVPVVIAK